MSIYLNLPSNSNMLRSPGNRPGDYTVHLSEPLTLNSDWEVGLAECIYTHDFPNIRTAETTITIDCLETKATSDPKELEAILKWEEVVNSKLSNMHVIFEGRTHYVGLRAGGLLNLPTFEDLVQALDADIKKLVPQFSLTAEFVGRKSYHMTLLLPRDAAPISFGPKIRDFFKIPSHEKLYAPIALPSQPSGDAGQSPSPPPPPTTPHKVEWTISDLPMPYGLFNRHKSDFFVIKRKQFLLPEQFYASSSHLVDDLQRLLSPSDISFALSQDKDEFFTLKARPKTFGCLLWWRMAIPQPLMDILGISRDQTSVGERGSFIHPEGLPHPATILPFDNVTFRDLMQILNKGKQGQLELRGRQPMNMLRGLDTMWVYSDIVADQIVGDHRSPLLRILPSRGEEYGETVMVQYDQPQYIPLARTNITSIRIRFFSTYGLEPIPFQSDVVVKLHFRLKEV